VDGDTHKKKSVTFDDAEIDIKKNYLWPLRKTEIIRQSVKINVFLKNFDPQFSLKLTAPKKGKSNLEDFFTTNGKQKRPKHSLKISKKTQKKSS
jgi:hypothetical protein